MSDVLGLIAGRGRFPLDIARAARAQGRRVVAIALHGQTDPEIDREAPTVRWVHPGQVTLAVDVLLEADVREAVMAGKVPKGDLFGRPEALRLDDRAKALLGGLPDLRDDSIQRLVADHLERHGIRLLPQAELVPELVGGPGPLGAVEPDADARADIDFGWPIAKTIAALDIGQTLVVKDRSVLAVEAIEGTDAAIARGGSLAAGACVVKVAKPDQDPRFDLPAIGPDTVSALRAARVRALAFEAGSTIVLDREAVIDAADRAKIALIGIGPQLGPPA